MDTEQIPSATTKRASPSTSTASGSAPKRRFIDSLASGMSKAPRDATARESSLSALIHLHEYVMLMDAGFSTSNFHHSCLLSSVVWNCVTKVRQEDNKGSGQTKNKIVEFKFVNTAIAQADIPEFVEAIRAILKLYGIDFAAKDNTRNGTFMAYLALVHSFKNALDEIRMVNNLIKVGKKDDGEHYTVAKDYGVSGAHYYQLKGINYPPILAGSLVSSLGPACLLIKLAQSDKKYADKWKRAVMNAFSQIPSIGGVVEQIAGAEKLAAPIIQKLCILSDYGVSRQANKCRIPYFAIRHSLEPKNLSRWIDSLKAVPLTAFPDNVNTAFVRNLDFSGHGAYGIYGNLAKSNFTFPGSLTVNQAKQCFFMAYFGLETEDMAISEFMLGNQLVFQHRSEMGDGLKEMGTKAGTVFQIQPVVNCSKLASASVANILPRGTVQEYRGKVIAGKVKIQYNEKDFKRLEVGTDEIISHITNSAGAVRYLEKYTTMVRHELMKKPDAVQGTTDWFLFDASTQGSAYGNKIPNANVVVSRRFFFNSPKALELEL